MISSIYRFHGYGSLRYVYTHGHSARSQVAAIRWTKNNKRRNPRFSVVVSKKVIKSAVGRNRIRRRIYEYIRLHIPQLNDVYDIVLIATSPELRMMPAKELTTSLDRLFEKAGLYKQTDN